MIQIITRLTDSRKHDTGVRISQKVVAGPENLLDRTISLFLPSPAAACELALRILMELVPAFVLANYKDQLNKLVKSANEGRITPNLAHCNQCNTIVEVGNECECGNHVGYSSKPATGPEIDKWIKEKNP